ncbi:MAG: hypothetical protein P8R39_11450 [Alphaproteobacteria bacterium]|nr:hypothetical protein [Alphaproteobacteria bacterium]
MSFSTQIFRPSGIAPARGGILESVTETINPNPPIIFGDPVPPFSAREVISDGSGDDTGGDGTGSGTGSPSSSSSAPSGSSGSSTPGNTTGGLPSNANIAEEAAFTVSNLAANPVDTISTKAEAAYEAAKANPVSEIGGFFGQSVGKGVAGALGGPAAFGGPIGLAAGLVGTTVGKGLGAVVDANRSAYTGWGLNNIVRAAIPFFGQPIRGSNEGFGMSQEDESEALASLAEEAVAMGTPEPEGMPAFGNIEAPTTPEVDIQMEIDIARANQAVMDMPGPQNEAEESAAEAAAARGNESELDAEPGVTGGGGGGDGSVVCSALHSHNLFDARGYFAANNYGAHLYRKNPSVMRGYWKIARPFVWLVNHTPSHGRYIIRPVMRAIVRHVSGHGSPVGALIVKTLSPLCALVGRKK